MKQSFRTALEGLAPWGVVELHKLGIYDLLQQAGGHHFRRVINYDEMVPTDVVESNVTTFPEMPAP